jgi:hypothetical protein
MPLPFAGPGASLAAWPVSNLDGTNLRASTVFLPETQALFARMTTPPTYARAVLINTLVGSLVTAGAWSKMDAWWVPAAADTQASLLNWTSSSYTLTPVNAPAFAADRGYTGNGTTSYLDTGFNPVTAAGQFSRDSACFGFWCVNEVTNANPSGSWDGTDGVTVAPRSGGGYASFRVNQATALSVASVVTKGLTVANRSAAGAMQGYRNGVSVGSATTASTAMNSLNLYLCSFSGVGFNTYQHGAAFAGSSLSAPEQLAVYNALNAYMIGVGAA